MKKLTSTNVLIVQTVLLAAVLLVSWIFGYTLLPITIDYAELYLYFFAAFLFFIPITVLYLMRIRKKNFRILNKILRSGAYLSIILFSIPILLSFYFNYIPNIQLSFDLLPNLVYITLIILMISVIGINKRICKQSEF